jgi:hypothetical protein
MFMLWSDQLPFGNEREAFMNQCDVEKADSDEISLSPEDTLCPLLVIIVNWSS